MGKPIDQSLTPILLRRFIKALAKCGNVTDACRKVRPKRPSAMRELVKYHRRHDPDFCAAFDEALDDYCDRLEREADRRALEGVSRLKTHRGEAIIDPRTGDFLEETQYSDRLLLARLAALRPERYATKRTINTRIDLKAQVLAMISDLGFVVRHADARYLSDEQIEQWRAIKRAVESGREANVYDGWHRQVETIEAQAIEVASDEKED